MTHLNGYHLRPWQNWCNDPNGLIYYEGKYHAFYQHYPMDPIWGPMHWGHAVSKDSYHWKHEPIAIYPDSNGYAFSGSAVHDKENVSGLGSDEGNGPLLLFYTSHRILDSNNPQNYIEEQSIAYSEDGVTFKPYKNNPVLKNQGTKDFRDPKLFYHSESKQWVMCLAVFDRIEFYTSQNLLDWIYLSSYTSDHPSAQGLWECSDLFSLKNNSEQAWVLIVSYGLATEDGRSITRYFIGDFDGKEFTSNGIAYDLDFGPDYYAGVTFADRDPVTTIGWAINWGYAVATPTEGFCGQMSGAREHYLFRDPDHNLRVGSKPIDIPEEYVDERKEVAERASFEGSVFLILDAADAFKLELRNELGEKVVIYRTADAFSVDRSASGKMDYHEMLEMDLYQKRTVAPLSPKPGTTLIFLDGPVLEVYADDGTLTFTFLVYPQEPYNEVYVEGTTVELKQLKFLEQIPSDEPFLNQSAYE